MEGVSLPSGSRPRGNTITTRVIGGTSWGSRSAGKPDTFNACSVPLLAAEYCFSARAPVIFVSTSRSPKLHLR